MMPYKDGGNKYWIILFKVQLVLDISRAKFGFFKRGFGQ
jgi:hypothetical protein